MTTLRSADPLWYKDAVFYQLHVKSFADSNADGIGDFPGLTSKLDHLASLGVDCLWLQPMYPSPFKDDGYDISDYTSIHPSYGTRQDFETFLSQAHARGLRVIIELVLNHTSDQHAWFQEARSSIDNPRRDWYVWSDTDDRYRGVRIIFIDTELSNWAWDPVSKAYYWHRFFSHQPDLNYDNPAVREEIWNVMKFWLDLGVDGFRVDAVPYLVEREGTSCENLPETHAVLKELRARLDAHFTGKVLLAEANMWPEDVRPYFGDGRRVPHVVPLSDHAPDVHGAPARRPQAAHRHHRAHAEHSRLLSVGHLPAQPRRADARDGDRDRTAVHVGRVRQGPASPHQPRDPTPARTAHGRRSTAHRADERTAHVAAGEPDPLLRR